MIVTFNSASGWRNSFERSIAQSGSLATVTDGAGIQHGYTFSGGLWLPASASAINALVQNGDNTWTETQADGFKIQYDNSSPALLTRLQTKDGSTWTLTYSGGGTSGQVTKVTGPFNSLLTLTYDTNSNLSQVTVRPGGAVCSALRRPVS